MAVIGSKPAPPAKKDTPPPTQGESLMRIEAVLKDIRRVANARKECLTQIYYALIPISIVAYLALAAGAIWLLFVILPTLLMSNARY